MTNRAAHTYINALLKTVKKPSPLLGCLRKHWPALEKQILQQRQRLSKKISADDPIRSPVDLLTPINRGSDESLHTRALAYLLNPSEEHDLGRKVLSAILTKLPRRRGAARLAALVRQKHTHIDVIPEYRYSIEGSSTRTVARNDIRIELRANRNAALMIIENKIDAPEGKDQLGWYELEARKWCKKNRGSSLLVYLGREKRRVSVDNDKWIYLSYLELASALRHVWRHSHPATPGRAWLGLYISAITGSVLGIDINRLQNTTLEEIDAYLGSVRQ